MNVLYPNPVIMSCVLEGTALYALKLMVGLVLTFKADH